MEDSADDRDDGIYALRGGAALLGCLRRTEENFLDLQDKILEDEAQFLRGDGEDELRPRGCRDEGTGVAGAGTVRNMECAPALSGHDGATDCGNRQSLSGGKAGADRYS